MDRLFYIIPIAVVVLLLFGGASRLPEFGAATGRAIREFRSAVSGGQEPASPGPMSPPSSQPSGFGQPGQWAPAPGDRPAAPFPDDTLRP